jgi:hypothetical protein
VDKESAAEAVCAGRDGKQYPARQPIVENVMTITEAALGLHKLRAEGARGMARRPSARVANVRAGGPGRTGATLYRDSHAATDTG